MADVNLRSNPDGVNDVRLQAQFNPTVTLSGLMGTNGYVTNDGVGDPVTNYLWTTMIPRKVRRRNRLRER